MTLNVQNMLNESAEALGAEEANACGHFIEKWVPEVVNEIESLRNRINLQDTRILDLENQLQELE